MNKIKFFQQFRYESIKIFFFIFSIYMLFNLIVMEGPYISFNDIEDKNKLILSFLILVFLFFIIWSNFRIYTYAFPLVFFILSIVNIYDVQVNYFWTTVPDSRTYASLGSSLFSCGRLALDCSGSPYLLFPIGQPIISGVIVKYFYNIGPYINIVLITFSLFVFQKIIKFHTGFNTGIGIFFILIHSLVYELTPLMLSEVSFTFVIMIFLYTYFTKSNNKYISAITYSFSILIRPIGIVLLPLIFIYSKSKKRFLIILISIIFFAAIFNFLSSDKFVVSEFNIDSQQDGFVENSDYLNYFSKVINFDTATRQEFFLYLQNNSSRLYGESSKECTFYSICNIYNPIYNTDGTESSYFKNSLLGKFISKFMTTIYRFQAPQGIFISILPITLITSFLFLKDKTIMFYLLSIISLIFPSIITSEYGSRWNYTILFLTGILIELLFAQFKLLYKNNVYRQ